MTKTILDAKGRENIKSRFEALVRKSRELKEQGSLRSGIEYFITPDLKISARTRVQQSDAPGPRPDLDATLKDTLEGMNEVRYFLSTWFDVTADEWNHSDIGRLLKFASDQLRTMANKKEVATSLHTEPVYDIVRILDLHEVLAEMAKLILAEAFGRLPHPTKLARLNEFAREASSTLRRRGSHALASSIAELTISIADLLALHPGDPNLERFVEQVVPPTEEIFAACHW